MIEKSSVVSAISGSNFFSCPKRLGPSFKKNKTKTAHFPETTRLVVVKGHIINKGSRSLDILDNFFSFLFVVDSEY